MIKRQIRPEVVLRVEDPSRIMEWPHMGAALRKYGVRWANEHKVLDPIDIQRMEGRVVLFYSSPRFAGVARNGRVGVRLREVDPEAIRPIQRHIRDYPTLADVDYEMKMLISKSFINDVSTLTILACRENFGDHIIQLPTAPGMEYVGLIMNTGRAEIVFLRDYSHYGDLDWVASALDALLAQIWEPVADVKAVVKKTRLPIFLGADPEFEVYTRDAVHTPANRYFPFAGEIGTDGYSAIMEIRPKPARTGEGLARNAAGLIVRAWECVNFTTRSQYDPTGGHIHVGGPRNDRDACSTVARAACKVTDVLDGLVGETLLEIAPPGRKNSNYNRLGGYETKPYGFEYRTPPSTVFSSPYLAAATAQLVGEVAAWVIEADHKVDKTAPPQRVEEALHFWKKAYEAARRVGFMFDIAEWFRWAGKKFVPASSSVRFWPTVRFPDYCTVDPSIREKIEAFLRDELAGLPVRVTIYPYRRERGLVTNFKSNVPGVGVDEYQPFNPEDKDYFIALPFIVRNDMAAFEQWGQAILRAACVRICMDCVGRAVKVERGVEGFYASMGIYIRPRYVKPN